jgi:hypothetical protein
VVRKACLKPRLSSARHGWSQDPQVVIFWFDPEVLAPGVRLDGIIARDQQGRKLKV